MHTDFCVKALKEAIARFGPPGIMYTDRDGQFTGSASIATLTEAGVRISMDGRGRCMDNIFIERLWRSLTQKAICLEELTDGLKARRVNRDGIAFDKTARPHTPLSDGSSATCAARKPGPGRAGGRPSGRCGARSGRSSRRHWCRAGSAPGSSPRRKPPPWGCSAPSSSAPSSTATSLLAVKAMITPPLGMNLFVMWGITDAPLADVVKGAAPYVVLETVGRAVMLLVPGRATCLPKTAGFGR